MRQARHRRDACLIWNNAQVDLLAKTANLDRGEPFWECWKTHVNAVHGAQTLHQQICRIHLAVAKRSVHQEDATTLDEIPVPAPRPMREFQMIFDVGQWAGELPQQFAQEYGHAMASRILRWWTIRTTGKGVGQLRWLPFAHLYVDYQLAFGCPGPVKSGPNWLDWSTRPYLEPEKNPFLSRLKWFRRCMIFFWKLTGQQVGLAQCRGDSSCIQSFVNCASLRWCCESSRSRTLDFPGAPITMATEAPNRCSRYHMAKQHRPWTQSKRSVAEHMPRRDFRGLTPDLE